MDNRSTGFLTETIHSSGVQTSTETPRPNVSQSYAKLPNNQFTQSSLFIIPCQTFSPFHSDDSSIRIDRSVGDLVFLGVAGDDPIVHAGGESEGDHASAVRGEAGNVPRRTGLGPDVRSTREYQYGLSQLKS